MDIGILSLGSEQTIEWLLDTEFHEAHPEISPDGRWIAYVSAESGEFEVYVRPFPNVSDGQWLVSQGPGLSPRWGADGRELFYLREAEDSNAVEMMLVAIETEPNFSPANPVALFDGPYRFAVPPDARPFDLASDGRFLMIKETVVPASDQPQFVVVLNWFQELKRLVPNN